MAAPTIHYADAAAGTGSGLIANWMKQLDALLVDDAGWERSYVDSDAIGSGSSGAPEWDKTPASNTDAGIAVYRMPANDHDTRWYVRLRPGWGGNANNGHMRGLTVGTTHDGSGGVTGAGSELVPVALSSTTNSQEWQAAVSEDGLALLLNTDATGVVIASIERARRGDTGAVTDEVIACNKANTSTWRLANASAGQVSDAPAMFLLANGIGTVATAPSLESRDATAMVLMGPYYPGGHPLWRPGRLWCIASPADVGNGATKTISIDGGPKAYQAAPGSISTTYGIFLVATE